MAPDAMSLKYLSGARIYSFESENVRALIIFFNNDNDFDYIHTNKNKKIL